MTMVMKMAVMEMELVGGRERRQGILAMTLWLRLQREAATRGIAPVRPPPITPNPESDFEEENHTPSQWATDSPHNEMISAPTNYGASPPPTGEPRIQKKQGVQSELSQIAFQLTWMKVRLKVPRFLRQCQLLCVKVMMM